MKQQIAMMTLNVIHITSLFVVRMELHMLIDVV